MADNRYGRDNDWRNRDRDRDRGGSNYFDESYGEQRGGRDDWNRGMSSQGGRSRYAGEREQQGPGSSDLYARSERQQWGQAGTGWNEPSDARFGAIPDFGSQFGPQGYQGYAPGGQFGQSQIGQDVGQHRDEHYHALRQRYLEQCDRDYDEFRRHRQDRIATEFEEWRRSRPQQGNVPISEIRLHMGVVDVDGNHVGTVDAIEGNRIKLARSDPSAGGQHHYIDFDQVQTVDEGRVYLRQTADDARRTWQAEQNQGSMPAGRTGTGADDRRSA